MLSEALRVAAGANSRGEGHNARLMGKAGSGSSPALPFPVATAAVVLGGMAMIATTVATAAWGLRPMLVASEAALVAPALLALSLMRVPWREGLGLRPPDPRTVGLSVAAGAAFWVASLGLFALQSAVWPLPPEYLEAFRRLHAALRPSGPVDAAYSLAAIAFAPAICEELLFRGTVLPSFRRAFGAPAALAISAFLFGVVHLDPYRFLFAAAVGVGLGVLRLRTGSVVPPLLAHGLLNAATFVAAPFVDDPQGSSDPEPWLGALLLLGGTAAAVLILRAIRPAPDTATRT
jgi:membrane protease YdiL (CAAX protease family)